MTESGFGKSIELNRDVQGSLIALLNDGLPGFTFT